MTTLYRIYGGSQRPLYIGITDDYAKRMRQHAEKAWWLEVKRITREEFDDRQSALDAERRAIQSENPEHNRNGKDEKPERRYIPKAKGYKAPDPWLGLADAAAYLDVTDRTIRNYIARGMLPASRVRGSRLIRIRLSSLDALLRPIPSAKAGL